MPAIPATAHAAGLVASRTDLGAAFVGSPGGTRTMIAGSDMAITRFGDANRYHPCAASSAADWSSRTLPTLQPGHFSDTTICSRRCQRDNGQAQHAAESALRSMER